MTNSNDSGPPVRWLNRSHSRFAGDGGLGMCSGELETLRRLDLDVTVVVFNDAALSLIEIKAPPSAGGSAPDGVAGDAE